jgi:CBS domain-containing protein
LNELSRSADLWEVKQTAAVESKIAGMLSLEMDEEYVDNLDQEETEPTKMQDRLETDIIMDLQPSSPITVERKTSLANAIRLMNNHNIGCSVVACKEGRLVGIFTEQDALTRLACQVEDLTQVEVGQFMTPEPFALRSDMSIKQALNLMSAHGFRHLPLVDDEYRPEGIISFRDVAQYLNEHIL